MYEVNYFFKLCGVTYQEVEFNFFYADILVCHHKDAINYHPDSRKIYTDWIPRYRLRLPSQGSQRNIPRPIISVLI